jgi:hypothetical protein
MKLLSTMLAAAFVAGSCTVAMAQAGSSGSSGSGSGAADSTQQGTMKDADKNPTGPGAKPSAGNTGAPAAPAARPGSATAPSDGMKSAPASNTRADDPKKPAGANDATGAKTGQGGGGGSK